jgi:hypothetical protein
MIRDAKAMQRKEVPRCGVVMQSAAWELRGDDVMRRCEGNAEHRRGVELIREEMEWRGNDVMWKRGQLRGSKRN